MKKLEKYLECARIVNTHGIKGTVRLENRCDSPKVLAGLTHMYKKNGEDFTVLTVTHASVQKNMVLADFEGVDSVEAASAMRGTVLYADRDDFALGEKAHFIADLIGLPVIDESGECVGKLSEVIQPGSQQLYVVKDGDESFMIPAVPEFILDIQLGDGEKNEGIYVHLIDGMRSV